MNLRLIRDEFRPDGIFSTLFDERGDQLAVTLEHAYDDGQGAYAPKIPPGAYTCLRGRHRLHGMTEGFETFEIAGVEGHKNLLFHWGNWNRDSEGCVLLGEQKAASGGAEMVTNSRVTFARFMAALDGVDEFELSVEAAA